jgi:hypothetical protein
MVNLGVYSLTSVKLVVAMSLDFAALELEFHRAGAVAMLAATAEQLKLEKKYHELFEALKMQVRHRLGLPLLSGESSSDDLPEATRMQLEEGLIDACRQVGELLLRAGRVREGWMYFRPVGDKTRVAELIANITPDEDNAEELIEVLLHESVDTARGFQLLLDINGTCNAITTFDQVIAGRPKKERQAAASALLRRVHSELVSNVMADIARQEGVTPASVAPAEPALAALIADRDWLFAEGAYHIDTTHLAAVVRMARVLEDPRELQLAFDLTEYGRRLSPQLQYEGDEPFLEQYPANALFFQALLGKQTAEAIQYFSDKAHLLEPQYHGTEPLEVYLDLLTRLQQPAIALQEALAMIPTSVPFSAYAPMLLNLCQQAENYSGMLDFCRSRQDVLGFAAALVKR